MVQYTLAEHPEVIIDVDGKDSKKSREKAMNRLVEMLDNEEISSNLPNGFGVNQFIEVKEIATSTSSDEEDEVSRAVQVLSNLASLKLKTQALKQDALQTRTQIDQLFSDDPITEEEVASLKEGFKVLKNFAQVNIRYRQAREQAEAARKVLDEALQD
jgi:CRISPR/Cas system CSM-associated protein Csm2 small subunit